MIEVHPQLAGTPVERAWGGQVALTLDRLPHCGRIDGLWYATGCNGSGVALNTWLGHRMAAAIDGEALPPFAELRAPPDPASTRCGGRGCRWCQHGSASKTGEQHEDPRGRQRRRGLGLRHDRPTPDVLRTGGAGRPRRGSRRDRRREDRRSSLRRHGDRRLRSRRGRRVRADPRRHPRAQRGRPPLRHADLRRRLRRRRDLPRHGDVALASAPRTTARAARREARRRAVRRRRRMGGAWPPRPGGHRRRAGAVRCVRSPRRRRAVQHHR